jgi:hypothetical protein
MEYKEDKTNTEEGGQRDGHHGAGSGDEQE